MVTPKDRFFLGPRGCKGNFDTLQMLRHQTPELKKKIFGTLKIY